MAKLGMNFNENVVDMTLEQNDTLKDTQFTIKFVAFKTPQANKPIPNNFFFIFKFFTFKNL